MPSMHSFNGTLTSQETSEHGRAPFAAAASAATSAEFSKGPAHFQGQREKQISMLDTAKANSSPTDRTPGFTTLDNPTLHATSLFPSLKLPNPLGAGEASRGERRSSQNGVDDVAMVDSSLATPARPASTSTSSTRPTQQHFSVRDITGTVESKEMDIDEHKSAVRSVASAGPARSALEGARSKLKMTFAAAAPAPASSLVVDGQASPDISCHCLVVDESKMPADSVDRSQLTTALGLTKRALALHVLTWLAITDPSDFSVAYIDRGSRLHLNFASMDGLARALARVPFLARCGSEPGIWTLAGRPLTSLRTGAPQAA